MNKDYSSRYTKDLWVIGDRIRRAREKRGISRFDLAESLGLKDERSIYYYEMGEKMPPLHRFLVICEILGVSLDNLLGN